MEDRQNGFEAAADRGIELSSAPPPEHVLYPNCYVWYVFLASLDILMTWIILDTFQGYEVNVLADWIIRAGGLRGAAWFKFGTVVLVVSICEIVGRRNRRLGKNLALWAVAITSLPVFASFTQLLVDFGAWALRVPIAPDLGQ